ncbi:glycosyltransferase family 4 protein [Rubrobacter indicoceani]|uniref:glycosyltransferase family 4 protein n=1 Tax=Rubrobacter indicoceani TaxID=2051957 RepID=UPI0013C48860|nr:glycosyltransferase family 4 protein [Rubrobacter indicoceani]
MKLLITHGYLLSGSGSNVYVQNLCRALTREGHDVDLLCQEADPSHLDFVGGVYTAGSEGLHKLWTRETDYPGECRVILPDIGDLLPVYVYDDYPGWRVKTFLDLTDGEFDGYVGRNVAAVKVVLEDRRPDCLVTNHSVPGPLIASRALAGTDVPYLSIVHGSCLQYVARKSGKYLSVARDGLSGAKRIISPSPHGALTITEDFPDLAGRTLALSGGVDTGLFTPDARDASVTRTLSGGQGRGPEHREAVAEALARSRSEKELLAALEGVSRSYDPRAHDRDAGARLEEFLLGDGPLVVYVGKLIHSKGVHSLVSAFAGLRGRRPDARLLIVGFGTFREGLEALTLALSAEDSAPLERLVRLGKRLEGQPSGGLEHFTVGADHEVSEGLPGSVLFVGPLDHGSLSKLLPFADAAVVPSIFPEIFGLVAAEFAASGVVPFVARHSGLAEAGAIVGAGLPFDVTVAMDDFERNLTEALEGFLLLSAGERSRCSRTVRNNSVRDLSWLSLARDLVALARGDTPKDV